MVKLTFALVVLAALVAVAEGGGRAEAHHNDLLPLVPNTAMIRNLQADGEQAWCVDQRAATYPSFVAQINDVNDEYERRVGIRHRQVPFASAECEIRHTMPDAISCNGCAANISYANWPVTVRYKWQLGYRDWRTTVGHELGHGLLGLHEQYIDLGSIQCDASRTDTVMSCGTGVRYPQQRDVSVSCSAIDPNKEIFSGALGCAPPPPPSCFGPPNAFGHMWNSCEGLWYASDGNRFHPPTGAWEWGDCAAWGGCYNNWNRSWIPAGHAAFTEISVWSVNTRGVTP